MDEAPRAALDMEGNAYEISINPDICP